MLALFYLQVDTSLRRLRQSRYIVPTPEGLELYTSAEFVSIKGTTLLEVKIPADFPLVSHPDHPESQNCKISLLPIPTRYIQRVKVRKKT